MGASAATAAGGPAASTPPPAAAAAAAPAAAAAAGSSVPAFKFDAARWSLADRIAGIASVVLFISLFLSWFGVSVIGITVTASGLSAHGYLYIVLILCILIVAYLALRAGWDTLPIGVNLPHLTVMLVATLVSSSSRVDRVSGGSSARSSALSPPSWRRRRTPCRNSAPRP
jgi:hypothetical protein